MTPNLFNSSHGATPSTAKAAWSFNDVPLDGSEDEDSDDCDASSIAETDPTTADLDGTSTQDNLELDGFSLLGRTFTRQSTPDSDEEEDETRAFKVQRDTARQAILFIGGLGGWLDNDQSGDYDPTQKIVVPTQTQRRKRALDDVTRPPRAASSSQGEAKRQKSSALAARQKGDGLEVVFPYKNFKIAFLCQSIPDDWPSEDSWNVFTDEGVALNSDADGTYNLRRRGRGNSNHSRAHSTTSDQYEDGISDLTGHPLARGCKGCREIGDRCSLLEPGAIYPCEACLETGHDCHLNVEPKHKQACEHCKQKRKSCSYDNPGTVHSQPCIGCAKIGFKCFAGPAQEYGRTRLTEEGLPATLPVSTTLKKQKGKARAVATTSASTTPTKTISRYLRCTACQESGRRCSLQKKKPELPCKHCKEDGTTCELETSTIEPPPPIPSRSSNAKLPKPSAIKSAPNISPGVVATSSSLIVKPETIKIKTRLAHPIYFNQRNNPCRWCQVAMFGLYGCQSVKTPTVAIWPNGLGYSELSGGHVAAGSPAPTYMCSGCTMSRLLVCACGGHELKQIEDPTVATKGYWDKNASLKRLTYTKPATTERREQERRWCILCPSLAKWECAAATSIPLDRMKEDVRNAMPKIGCGLRLCGACASILKDACKGNFNLMVKNMDKAVQIKRIGKENWPEGLRADYDFFQEGSFLLKQVASGGKM